MKSKNLFVILAVISMVAIALTLALVATIPSIEDVCVEANDNIRQQDFSNEKAVVLLKYRDGSVKNLKVTEDMLSDEDLAKLQNPGKHTITINYKNEKACRSKSTC